MGMTLNYNITEDGLWVMTFADMAAAEDDRKAVSPLDVLLGLMLLSDPEFSEGHPSVASHLLRAACLHPDDLPKLRDLGWTDLPGQPAFGGAMTPDATELLEVAMVCARDFETPYIGAEHLLVSVLAGDFGPELELWIDDSGVSEAEVFRQWVGLLLRIQGGDIGLGSSPIVEA
jgi:hypothetical protein